MFKLFCASVAGGVSVHLFYKYRHRCDYTQLFRDYLQIKREQDSTSIESQMSHILKPDIDVGGAYVNFSRFTGRLFNYNQFDLYRQHSQKIYNNLGFKNDDIDLYQNYNSLLIELNSRMLTRKLFKENDLEYNTITDYWYPLDESELELEVQYEKILNKMIDKQIIRRYKPTQIIDYKC